MHYNDISLLCRYFSVIFGEDVAFGGVFRCTVGLRDKYGKLALKSDIGVTLASLFFCSPLWLVGEEPCKWTSLPPCPWSKAMILLPFMQAFKAVKTC